ncbi:MAG: AMP-binding protein [Granulosicoccus sp.]
MSNNRRKPIDNKSQVAGATDVPLSTHTVSGLLRETAGRFPNSDAAVFCADDQRWSYKEFDAKVDRLAAGLVRLGLQKGDRLGIWAPNCPEWLLAQFATARVGVILVNINPAYRLRELSFALEKVACRALITAERFKSSDYIAMLQELLPELNSPSKESVKSDRLPALEFIIKTGDERIPGMLNFNELMLIDSSVLDSSVEMIESTLHSSDPINIQFTSGTTGLPKGATLTHHNIVNNARHVVAEMKLTEQDKLCIPVPFYHCFGMVMGTLGSVSCGATMVIPAAGFDPVSTLKSVNDERCTALYGVPTMFVAMLESNEFPSFDVSSLRTGIMAGAPCPVEVMKRVQANMHMNEVTIAYGMTETSPVSFQSAVDDPLDKRVSSVGRVHPHVEVKIIDRDGSVVPVGEQGELCTRGYSVMQGYWEEEAQTRDCIDAENWMHTGDLATIAEDGYCKITGRLKDVIIRGGENIYPKELEDFLYTIPGVAQVQVFGLPDKHYGEVVTAWFVLQENAQLAAEDVFDYCKGQIAHQKVPTIIEFVDALPMTVTGKPQKFVMRDIMIEKLGLQAL